MIGVQDWWVACLMRIRFMIAKLMPFCKAVKPPSPTQDLYNSVHYTCPTTTSYAPQPDFNNYVTATTTPLPPKVAFFLQPLAAPKGMEKKMNGVEDSVDARATSYISSVRERFRLDHSETTVISLDEDVDH